MGTAKLIGIDVGTTGAKAVLMDAAGAIRASATEEYPLLTPKPAWAEQNPDAWWAATCRALRRLLSESRTRPGDIVGVGLTGQMHGSVFLDADNRVVCPAILWCDQRTGAECREITRRAGERRVRAITCNPVLTGFQAPKILWLMRNRPAAWRRVRKVLLPKDYVRFRLTGAFATDVSDASGTSLLDVRRRRWSPEMLAALKLPPSFLPDVFESAETAGSVSREGMKATGLAEGTPLAAGAGDQAAGGVGAGIVEPGLLSLSLGTSGVAFAHADRPLLDPGGRLHTFCHAVPGAWHLMGVMLSAGGSWRWCRDTLRPELRGRLDAYASMEKEAAKAPPGSGGVLFLPYLTGERCPHPDPAARGVFFGLSLAHTRAHLLRSVLEGVAFGLKDSVEIMAGIGLPLGRKFRISGGGAKSDLWCSIFADVLDRSMVRLLSEEGPSQGAALLAGVAAGVYPDVRGACRAMVGAGRAFTPTRKRATLYARLYPLYRELYTSLKARFASLADIDTDV